MDTQQRIAEEAMRRQLGAEPTSRVLMITPIPLLTERMDHCVGVAKMPSGLLAFRFYITYAHKLVFSWKCKAVEHFVSEDILAGESGSIMGALGLGELFSLSLASVRPRWPWHVPRIGSFVDADSSIAALSIHDDTHAVLWEVEISSSIDHPAIELARRFEARVESFLPPRPAGFI